LFNLVKAGLMDPDMQDLPCDYEKGSDFRIVKTSKGTTKGQYADYSTSSYGKVTSALTKTEREAIETYKLSTLSDFLGKKPTQDDLKVIREMFEASVDGEAYDPEKWGNYYKPAGFKSAKDTEFNPTELVASTTETKETVENKETAAPAPVVTVTEESAKKSASEILDMIKNRSKKTAA
jgi:hypothetical protein